MSEKIYEEAWLYTMNELKKEYESQNKEDQFKIWFNMHYVEDTIDSVTVSVSSNFLKTSMEKKGSFEIVKNKLREVIGQNDIELKCIIVEDTIHVLFWKIKM